MLAENSEGVGFKSSVATIQFFPDCLPLKISHLGTKSSHQNIYNEFLER